MSEGTNGRVAGKASVCAGTGWGGPLGRRVSDARKDVGGGARILSCDGARVTSYKIGGGPLFELEYESWRWIFSWGWNVCPDGGPCHVERRVALGRVTEWDEGSRWW